MDIEIAGCNDQDFAFQLGPEHEVLPDGEWVCWARRLTGYELFLYHHKIHKTFVLCQWLDREKGTCVELEAFPLHPGEYPGQMPRDRLLSRCRSEAEQFKAMRDSVINKRLAKKEALEEEWGERKEVAARMRRRGKLAIAASLESGQMPYMGTKAGGERLAETRKALKKAARNPVSVVMPGDKP